MSHLNTRVFVAGHRGMVGSAIVRGLRRAGYTDIVTRPRGELDLTDQAQVRSFFAEVRPRVAYLAAAMVGGIHANDTFPAEFIHSNLMIQTNVVHQAWQSGVERLLFLGSSCVYPRLAPQPMEEGTLLTGKLEPTNEPYAVAKIAGIKMCESYNRQYGTDFRSVMPTNLYGPGDHYHPLNSHVLPALIRRFHEARQAGAPVVTIWGTGQARREFLHVDDMARACLHVMELDKAGYQRLAPAMQSHINIGAGADIAILDLAALVARVVGYEGRIATDPSRPDGMPRKLLDCSRLTSLGWKPTIALADGIAATYRDYLEREPRQAQQPEMAAP